MFRIMDIINPIIPKDTKIISNNGFISNIPNIPIKMDMKYKIAECGCE
jgi:hypothetical protein